MLKLHSQVIGFSAPVPLARAFLSMVLRKLSRPFRSLVSLFPPHSMLLFILRNRSQDQIKPRPMKVWRLKRSLKIKKPEQTVLAHEIWEERTQ